MTGSGRRSRTRRVALRGGALLWAVFTVVAVVAGLAAASSVQGAISGAASRPRTAAQVHDALRAVPTPSHTGSKASSPSPRSTPATHRPHPTGSGTPTATSSPGHHGSGPSQPGGSSGPKAPGTTASSRPPGGPGSSGGPGPGSGSGGGPGNGSGGSPGGEAVRATLSSSAGTVVASCRSSQVTLVTWSPAIGYRVDEVHGGPAREVEITFTSDRQHDVTMVVTCSASGEPRASVHGDSHADNG